MTIIMPIPAATTDLRGDSSNMDLEKRIDEIEALIKAKGYKQSVVRKEMVRLFATSEEHMRPLDVYFHLRDKKASLPSVYRNIDLLKRLGIIKEVVIHNDRYYELIMFSQKRLHMHFNCKVCGMIKEYADLDVFREMIRYKELVESIGHDKVEDVEVIMTGICESCGNQEATD